jgi:membrane protein implicated in regulation of membrane protease activity
VNDPNPRTLLLIMVGVVPVVVAVMLLISFLLLRAGYGLLVAGLLPFAVMVLVVAVLGVVFGRAASKRREADDRRSGRRDDV